MATALLTDTDEICFDDDITTVIKKAKNKEQHVGINTIHKKIINISDFHDVSKEFPNIRLKIF